jgi:hypothetical protein
MLKLHPPPHHAHQPRPPPLLSPPPPQGPERGRRDRAGAARDLPRHLQGLRERRHRQRCATGASGRGRRRAGARSGRGPWRTIRNRPLQLLAAPRASLPTHPPAPTPPPAHARPLTASPTPPPNHPPPPHPSLPRDGGRLEEGARRRRHRAALQVLPRPLGAPLRRRARHLSARRGRGAVPCWPVPAQCSGLLVKCIRSAHLIPQQVLLDYSPDSAAAPSRFCSGVAQRARGRARIRRGASAWAAGAVPVLGPASGPRSLEGLLDLCQHLGGLWELAKGLLCGGGCERGGGAAAVSAGRTGHSQPEGAGAAGAAVVMRAVLPGPAPSTLSRSLSPHPRARSRCRRRRRARTAGRPGLYRRRLCCGRPRSCAPRGCAATRMKRGSAFGGDKGEAGKREGGLQRCRRGARAGLMPNPLPSA